MLSNVHADIALLCADQSQKHVNMGKKSQTELDQFFRQLFEIELTHFCFDWHKNI